MSTQEATLLAACLAFLAALTSAIVAFWNGAQSRRLDALTEIASHRLKWIDEVRQLWAEYMMICTKYVSYTEEKGEEIIPIIIMQHRFKSLLINPEHSGLLDAMINVGHIACAKADNEGSASLALGEAVHAAQNELSEVLQFAWKKSEREINGGAA